MSTEVQKDMKRASVTITDDLEKALEAYCRDQDIPPRLVDVMQAALKEFLEGRGYTCSVLD